MKFTLLAGLGAMSALTLVSGPEMAFSVEAGAKHQKTYTHTLQLEVDSAVVRMGDVEEDMPDDFSMEINHDVTRAFLDHYVACEGGRPTHVERTLTEFEDNATGQITRSAYNTDEPEISMESEIEGELLHWKWSDDEYRVRPAEEDSLLDEEQLSGLTFDLDGLGLLPKEGSDVNSGWQVEGSALLGLLNPGGDFQCMPSEAFEGERDAIFRILALMPALGELEGEVQLSPTDEDEWTFEVSGELSALIDAWHYVETWSDNSDAPFFQEVSSLEIGTELDLEGTLTWDPGQGCLTGFALTADVERVLSVTGEQSGMPMDLEMIFTGEAEWGLEVEPVRG